MSSAPIRRSGWVLFFVLAFPAIFVCAVINFGAQSLLSRWFGSEAWTLVAIGVVAFTTAMYFVIDWLSTNKRSIGSSILRSVLMFIVIAIPLAIAIPSLLNSAQRSRQKETLTRMRAIAEAIDEYAMKQGRYPNADSLSGLGANVPHEDAWSHPFVLRSRPATYVLISYGLGGTPDVRSPDDYQRGETTQFEEDIVIRDGQFIRYPEGSRLQ